MKRFSDYLIEVKEEAEDMDIDDMLEDMGVMEFETDTDFFEALDYGYFFDTEDIDNPKFRILVDADEENKELSEITRIIQFYSNDLEQIKIELKSYEKEEGDVSDKFEEIIIKNIHDISNLAYIVSESDALFVDIETSEDIQDKLDYIYGELIEDIAEHLPDGVEVTEDEEADDPEVGKKWAKMKAKQVRKERPKRMSKAQQKKLARQYKKRMKKKRGKPARERLSLQKALEKFGGLKKDDNFDDKFPPTKSGGKKLAQSIMRVYKGDWDLLKKKVKASYSRALNSLGKLGDKMKEKKGKLTRKDKFMIRQKNKKNPKWYRQNVYYHAIRELAKLEKRQGSDN